MAELLLQSGANVNIQNSSCWSALHLAVHCGKQECVQLLLEKDCDLFVKNKDGKTAEDLALATGNEANWPNHVVLVRLSYLVSSSYLTHSKTVLLVSKFAYF